MQTLHDSPELLYYIMTGLVTLAQRFPHRSLELLAGPLPVMRIVEHALHDHLIIHDGPKEEVDLVGKEVPLAVNLFLNATQLSRVVLKDLEFLVDELARFDSAAEDRQHTEYE